MNSQPKIYGYIRWSSDIQEKGDSLARQTGMIEKWVQDNGRSLGEISILKDEGVSAYGGDNLKEGAALHSFIRNAENGLVPHGSVLLVENTDRLSRQGSEQAMDLITQIIRPGIKLITLSDGEVFEYGKRSVYAMMKQIIESERAHSESKEKARRVKDAWASKHKAAREHGKPVTAKLPAWLKLSEGRTEILVIPERAALVRRIFEMCLDGEGLTSIANALNQEGIKPWGPKRTKGRQHQNQPHVWRTSYIKKILSNGAVHGRYQPHARKHQHNDPDASKPIDGYFPAVVDIDTFNQANGALASRVLGSGRTGKVSNLFTYLVRCGHCGSSVMHVNKGNNRLKGGQYLRCSLQKSKGDCDASGMNYHYFEDAFLQYCRELNLDDLISQDKRSTQRKEVQAELDAVRGALIRIEEKVQAAVSVVGTLTNQTMIDRMASELDRFGEEKDRLERSQRELESKLEALSLPGNSAAEQIQNIRAIQEKLNVSDEKERITLRKRLKNSISGLVAEIVIYPDGVQGAVAVFTDSGLELVQHDGIEHKESDTRALFELMRDDHFASTTGRENASFFVRFKNGHSRLFKWDKNSKAFVQAMADAFGEYEIDGIRAKKNMWSF